MSKAPTRAKAPAAPKDKAEPPAGHDPALIARLCERLYRSRLSDQGARMVAEDKDDGTKLRRRAMAYAPLVAGVLDGLALEKPA